VVGDVGGPAVLLGLDLLEEGEDGGHRVVDPDVDRPQLGLDALGGGLDRIGVGDVGGQGQCRATGLLDLSRDAGERLFAAGEQRDLRPVAAEAPRDRSADSRPGARDDYDLSLEIADGLPLPRGATRKRRRRPGRLSAGAVGHLTQAGTGTSPVKSRRAPGRRALSSPYPPPAQRKRIGWNRGFGQ